MSLIAMEWGFRAHEKGMNLEMAREEYQKLMTAQAELQPVWRSELFTDEERELMMTAKIEEIQDCSRDYARDELDGEELIEVLAMIDPDIEVTVELLKAIDNKNACMADYETGEFGHHLTSSQFMARFNMVEGDQLTPFGLKYLREYS